MSWAGIVDEDGWVHTIPWDDDRHRPASFHQVSVGCPCFPTLSSHKNDGPLSKRSIIHHDACWPGHDEADNRRLN